MNLYTREQRLGKTAVLRNLDHFGIYCMSRNCWYINLTSTYVVWKKMYVDLYLLKGNIPSFVVICIYCEQKSVADTGRTPIELVIMSSLIYYVCLYISVQFKPWRLTHVVSLVFYIYYLDTVKWWYSWQPHVKITTISAWLLNF